MAQQAAHPGRSAPGAAAWPAPRSQQPQLRRPRQPRRSAGRGHRRDVRVAAAADFSAGWVAGGADRTMQVKLSLARTSGRLDLSWQGLEAVPPAIFELDDLEELTLAGNRLRSLPPEIAKFGSLRRLQAAGNQLTALPDELCQLSSLEELWLHSNLLESLPDGIGALGSLQRLSLAGNRLAALPASLGRCTALRDLSLSGNRLRALPPSLGSLSALEVLSLNGNELASLPPELGRCAALRELALQCNALTALPAELTRLAALEELNLSDNMLQSLPETVSGWERLKTAWLYGNRLTALPGDLLALPRLQCAWAEGNPLEQGRLAQQLAAAPPSQALRELGLDATQVAAGEAPSAGAWPRVKVTRLAASGRGYFRLVQAGPERAGVLVVTFASAPGTPNWGGVLSRLQPAAPFDTLFVCDGARGWYGAGDAEFARWEGSIQGAVAGYGGVLMLGDSMGATGALLFSHLATAVRAFTPQVDLASASMRPGQAQAWLAAGTQRVLASVAGSEADIEVHVGTWEHDLEQAKLLPEERCQLVVHHIDSHRLALALAREGRLAPLVRTAVEKQAGSWQPPRLANLL